jgi:RHS repeat-associated protein
LHHLATIFLTQLFFFGGNFAGCVNQASSASLGAPCASVVNSSSIRRTTPDGKTIDLTNNPTSYAQVIEEKDPRAWAGDQLKKVHLYGHDLESTESRNAGFQPASSLFYSYDGLGSVRSITNSTGDLQETYDYDAYGTLIGLAKRNASTGVLESTLLTDHSALLTQSEYLFTGEQYDSDLGMYFLRARYLNTNTEKFHNQDSYEGNNGDPLTLHKYLYANGNPVMMSDPSGNFSLSELSLTIGISIQMNVLDNARVMGTTSAIFSGLTIVALLNDPVGFYEDVKEDVAVFGPAGVEEELAVGLTRTSRGAIAALKRFSPFLDSGMSISKRYAAFQKIEPQLRRILQARPGKTVALGQMEINGELISLPAVSGQPGNMLGAPFPGNPQFSPIAFPAGTTPRASDAEYKIIKQFAAYLRSSGGRPSKVSIWISHPGGEGACGSCSNIIREFESKFGVKVDVVSGAN